jgi:alkanesulfonate monooxygenase SsuD/methylene tetrahydromethanopterin reductase-like flavin-dependent oxidoreductase (luciferase family)
LFRASSAAEHTDGARRIEAAGYDVPFTGDHFMPGFFSAVPTLLAAAHPTNNAAGVMLRLRQ